MHTLVAKRRRVDRQDPNSAAVLLVCDVQVNGPASFNRSTLSGSENWEPRIGVLTAHSGAPPRTFNVSFKAGRASGSGNDQRGFIVTTDFGSGLYVLKFGATLEY